MICCAATTRRSEFTLHRGAVLQLISLCDAFFVKKTVIPREPLTLITDQMARAPISTPITDKSDSGNRRDLILDWVGNHVKLIESSSTDLLMKGLSDRPSL
jgi:hypothetical protein